MFKAFANIFKIPELRTKLLFTFGMLAIYRIGYWIPLPGVDQQAIADLTRNISTNTDSAAANAVSMVAMMSGGSLSNATVFGLGIMPYITAAIIFQLLGSAIPRIKEIQQEGPTGQQKIQEWTRYATLGVALLQSFFYLQLMYRQSIIEVSWMGNPMWWIMAVGVLTAGAMFLMWLGEQIDRHGIGSGASLIITASILTGIPGALNTLRQSFDQSNPDSIHVSGLLILFAGFVTVTAGAVLLTVAQRRVPIQQAKHMRGRLQVGGQKSYLPLRVNHAGVMPIIFASALMTIPSVLFEQLGTLAATSDSWFSSIVGFINRSFSPATVAFPYVLAYIVLVFFFSYFWITVQFSPEDISKQLRDSGSFIPGLRPGPRTAEYIDTVMSRITYCGAGILAVMAILPSIVAAGFNIPFLVTQFLGGTGLLIVVSVTLDFIQRIEAALMMRNYGGFLSGEDTNAKKRIRGPRG
ncbi:MAG: preprotein translocase subunit SecY [Phycisphaeraceae bacterium]|nr:preprotein translocase subunit SecY [Phycisphaerales bacterium]MCB9860293.1 preprotein translocase subunit SecY [Phycisphaeraceae bacterium]